MEYLAHKREDGMVQTIEQHSRATAELCANFAITELKELCYNLGYLHDLGKFQPSFQRRIRGENIRVEHSVCGAQFCREQWPQGLLQLLAELCIAGHHTGLPDCGSRGDEPYGADIPTLQGRMKRTYEDISSHLDQLEQGGLAVPDYRSFIDYLTKDCRNDDDLVEKFSFLVRYCYSCLTDADSLDTAEFMSGRPTPALTADFDACLQAVNQRLSSFLCEPTKYETPLQQARSRLQQQAFDKLWQEAEIYLLNMPTGSGKTLCSIKLALELALRQGKKRIIYIIPYNSIIDQTADEFSALFEGCAQLLRHQSTFSYEDDDKNDDKDEDFRRVARLACENWDAPLIITTAVQFFESVCANKRGKLRKLHNLADSVLVFDEAHLMPISFLQPCLRSIAYITRCLNSKALFLTATMPDFSALLQRYALPDSQVCNLIDDQRDFTHFAKCCYVNAGELSDQELINRAAQSPSCLILVNSKRTARQLYRLCPGQKYHLSKYMASCDLAATIAEIKRELKRLEEDYPGLEGVPPQRRIMVVSTSLIEAGVDLDFYSVWRELTGLDSILQAGGRCNREGWRQTAQVFIFRREENQGKPLRDERAAITLGLLDEFTDVSSAPAIDAYYQRLFYLRQQEMISHSMSRDCHNANLVPFAEYSRQMRLIDSRELSVVVERDQHSRELIAQMHSGKPAPLRQLQPYCCSVYPGEFDQLLRQRVLDDYGSGVYCLTNQDYYNPKIGILLEGVDKYVGFDD